MFNHPLNFLVFADAFFYFKMFQSNIFLIDLDAVVAFDS